MPRKTAQQLDNEIAASLLTYQPPAKTIRPSASIESQEGYIYHATNRERAVEIAKDGLKPHAPSFGTDQNEWPDGSREKRSYWISRAGSAWSFAPEYGEAVLLRALRSQLDTKIERGTGDVVTTKKVPVSKIEILTEQGWIPLKSWAS